MALKWHFSSDLPAIGPWTVCCEQTPLVGKELGSRLAGKTLWEGLGKLVCLPSPSLNRVVLGALHSEGAN